MISPGVPSHGRQGDPHLPADKLRRFPPKRHSQMHPGGALFSASRISLSGELQGTVFNTATPPVFAGLAWMKRLQPCPARGEMLL
ncbi:hypothetical protein C3Y89_07205 [Rhizobium sp. UPM1132]|jgi:hypothetical protein|nr:hypothetical protein [Rhizobium ruizarguesonis]NKQ76498.1 hypothetical protein [Rhizobium ruizarguesonis]